MFRHGTYTIHPVFVLHALIFDPHGKSNVVSTGTGVAMTMSLDKVLELLKASDPFVFVTTDNMSFSQW